MNCTARIANKQEKRIICFIFLSILLFLTGFACTENSIVDLEVELNDLKNQSFPCNIKIFVDDDEIVTTRCRGTYSTQLEISQGTHIIWFYTVPGSMYQAKYQALKVQTGKHTKIKCRVNAHDTWPKLFLDKVTPSSAIIIPYRSESEGWHCNKCGKLTDFLFQECVFCGNERAGKEVVLSFKFKANLIFSKYDVNVFVDNLLYERLSHGANLDINCYLSPGKHIISLQKFDNNKVHVEKEITIGNDSLVKIGFEVKRNAINITDYDSSLRRKDDHLIYFRNTKGVYSSVYKFNVDTSRFEYYGISSPSHGKKSWSDEGTYTIDPTDGAVTLMYDDGKKELFFYEVVLRYNNPEEALIPAARYRANEKPRTIDDNEFLRSK